MAPGNRGGRGRGFKVGEKKGAGSRGCASDVVFTTSFPRWLSIISLGGCGEDAPLLARLPFLPCPPPQWRRTLPSFRAFRGLPPPPPPFFFHKQANWKATDAERDVLEILFRGYWEVISRGWNEIACGSECIFLIICSRGGIVISTIKKDGADTWHIRRSKDWISFWISTNDLSRVLNLIHLLQKKGRLYKSSLKANSKIGKSIIPSTDTNPC